MDCYQHLNLIRCVQILSTRKRKDAQEADIKVQVCVFVFDLLYLNGEPYVTRPLLERRAALREHLQEKEGERDGADTVRQQLHLKTTEPPRPLTKSLAKLGALIRNF